MWHARNGIRSMVFSIPHYHDIIFHDLNVVPLVRMISVSKQSLAVTPLVFDFFDLQIY